MKLKLAIATCLAAAALPMAPALADEPVEGQCYETRITPTGRSNSYWDCECIIGVPWLIGVNPDVMQVTIQYCHAGDRII